MNSITLLSFFLNMDFKDKILCAIVLLILIAMLLVFVYKVVQTLLGSTMETVCNNVFKVLGREISKGIRNGSRVERADYIAGLLVAGVSVVFIIASLCSNIKGSTVGAIMAGCLITLMIVLLVSVWLVVIEEERMKIIDSINHINSDEVYVLRDVKS